MDKKQAGEFIKLMAAAYPNPQFTEDRILLWTNKLANIDQATAMKRLNDHIDKNIFPPTIAHILSPEEAKRKKWDEPDTLSPAAVMQGGYRLM